MRKIIGFCIVTLLIGTAVLPVLGTMNKIDDSNIFTSNHSEIQWSKTYGRDEADKFWDVEETDDGGYIACGTTEESENHHPWVVKVDSDGNEMWDWSISEFDYGGTLYDITYCWCDVAKQTSDGGYIVALSALIFEYNDEEQILGGLLKLDSNGAEEWMKIYGEPFIWKIDIDAVYEVEDGFIGMGNYGTPLRSDRYYGICIFKTDTTGELQWYKYYYPCDYLNLGRELCFTNDGGFLLAGEGNDYEDFNTHPWKAIVVKTDSQGEEEWSKTFSGPKYNGFGYCAQIDNGDFVLGGYTESYGFGKGDVWVMRTDVNGNEIWNKTFGTGKIDQAFDADITDDGGFVIPLMIGTASITTDCWVVKMDSDGNVEWKHIYDVEIKQFFIGICSTSDGGCITAGISGNWDSGGSDALLVKYAPMENQRPNKPTINGPKNGQPYVEFTFTASSTDPDGDSLSYMWDWGDGNFSDWLDINEVSYTWTTENNFKIRVIAMDEHGGESEWSDPFTFSTPKIKVTNLFNQIMERFIQRFPILEILIYIS